MSAPSLFIIEHCTARVWLFSVFPRLRNRASTTCLVIDRSSFGWQIARLTSALLGVRVDIFDFRLIDVKDAEGLGVQLKIACMETVKIYDAIRRDPVYRQFEKAGAFQDRAETFVYKTLCDGVVTAPDSLGRQLYLILLAEWKRRRHGGVQPVLFIRTTAWGDILRAYAAEKSVLLMFVPAPFHFLKFMRDRFKAVLPGRVFMLANLYRYRKQDFKNATYRRSALGWLFRGSPSKSMKTSAAPRLGVEYYGHLNINKPELFSDLFFWQQSDLKASDGALLFGVPFMPFDQAKSAELSPQGISAVALRPEATKDFSVPVYDIGRQRPTSVGSLPSLRGNSAAHVRAAVSRYRTLKENWFDVFRSENLKVYLTWFRYSADHCAIADAMQKNGGVTALYQRSFDAMPTPDIAVSTDVVFAFSRYSIDTERRSLSQIPYGVITGYIGDYRFPLVKAPAAALRQSLAANGARKVITMFDENSLADNRWDTGHDLQRVGYKLLCEKVLGEPWLGVIFKPKVPRTLRKRLGPVADVLKAAEATGRCVVLHEGERVGSRSPAEAALASDVAIHNGLFAGTAGLEAALAGVPTLLLDLEGWHVSPFYQLGVGRVVFKNWEHLWDACHEYLTKNVGVPGFGDWSPLLPEMDPFRDGQAANRVGTYLRWLLEGFKEGKHRDVVMAQAADRYAERWGSDKIFEIGNEIAKPRAHVLTQAL